VENNFNNLHLDQSFDGTRVTKYIYAIYGIVEFETQKYLIVVSEANFSANLADHLVFQATKLEFIPLATLNKESSQDQVSS
jgi:hypothetical protein